jgi:CheY-like chemotaxis protein
MKKVLIIDDESDGMMLLSLALSQRGYEVQTVRDWQDTFEMVDNFKPDLILLDVFLNGVDGRIIAKNLKLSDKTKSIKIILVSGSARIREDFTDSQADDFISKPINVNTLVQKFSELEEYS